ncbi:MAG: hypothetical protein U0359_21655 [Byssovorax sp.]
MRTSSVLMGFVLLSCTCLGFFACVGPDPGSSATNGTGGEKLRCEDVYIVGDPCDPCLHEKCCDLLLKCNHECLDCLRGALPCNETANEIFRCGDTLCLNECPGPPLSSSSSGGTGGSGTGGAGGMGGAGGK